MTAPLQRSSGDLRADRRYTYARAALEDCDGRAAADLFRQTLELVPNWAPAHFGLGEALALEGEREAAATSFRRTLELEPVDALGAALQLARLGSAPATEAMRPGYVAALFDEYADRFDDHLVNALNYRGPQIVAAALREVCAAQGRALHFVTALDIGCGTGLMARALAGCVDAVDGVDLSPAMAKAAERSGLYRDLRVADAVEALHSSHRYPLLLAADVLVYISDLYPLFAAAQAALEPTGLFAFSVQSHDGDSFTLGEDLRFHHSEAYLRATAADASLTVAHLAPCVTRKNAGSDVPGFVVVLEKTVG